MHLLPDFALTWFNGFLSMIPLFIWRFALPAAIDRDSLPRLEYFPPTVGKETVAKNLYFVTNTAIIFSPLVMRIRMDAPWFELGIAVHLLGSLLMILSIATFAHEGGFRSSGVYAFSRNPMYIGYYLMFTGTGLLVGSVLFLLLVQLYQGAVHWLVLSEERWCRETFGPSYETYMQTVPRYLGIRKVHSSE